MGNRAVEREAAPDQRRARSREPTSAPSKADGVLALQRSAGNRATAQLLQRFPNAADIDSFWSELVRQVQAENRTVGDLDCRAAANRVARIGQSKAKKRGIKANRAPLNDRPLYRISQDDLDAEPSEAKDARGRGWRVRDRVVSALGRDFMKVWSGGADGATPSVKFYPLLPGMMIYSAESVGWKDKKERTYRWYLRHAAVYAGDGWVRENFDAQRRNIMQGHSGEDVTLGAYGRDDDPKFLTTLAIYDPFYAYRTEAEEDWLRRGPMTGLRATWDAAKQWFTPP